MISQAVSNQNEIQSVHFILADATALPFQSERVDFVISHFTLMWIPERIKAIKEIKAVLFPQGTLACIEPDYAGRIEVHRSDSGIKPKPPFPIVITLTRLGADPFTGGQLPGELQQLDFQTIRFGVLSWTFDAQAIRAEILSEADLLQEKGVQWTLPSFIYTPIFWILAEKSLK